MALAERFRPLLQKGGHAALAGPAGDHMVEGDGARVLRLRAPAVLDIEALPRARPHPGRGVQEEQEEKKLLYLRQSCSVCTNVMLP